MHRKVDVGGAELGQPGDVVHRSLYLCSDDACYVREIELAIDSGWGAY